MSKEWDLMKKISESIKKGGQSELSGVILNNSFHGMNRAIGMAIGGFEITSKNIKENHKAAIKLSKMDNPESIRESIRMDFLIDKLEDIKQSPETIEVVCK